MGKFNYFLLVFSSLIVINVSATEVNDICGSMNLGKSEELTPTEQRDAMINCKTLIDQKTELLQAQKKLDEMKRELSSLKPTLSPGSNTNAQRKEIDLDRMMQSDEVFLLSASGRKGSRVANLFYKGSSYYVKEGDSFPGGQLVETDGQNAVIQAANGERHIFYLTTLDEIRSTLGIVSDSNQSKIIPLGTYRK